MVNCSWSVSFTHYLNKSKKKSNLPGAILGDSLGLATEGLSKAEVRKAYGKGPIRFGMDEEGESFLRDSFRSNFEEK